MKKCSISYFSNIFTVNRSSCLLCDLKQSTFFQCVSLSWCRPFVGILLDSDPAAKFLPFETCAVQQWEYMGHSHLTSCGGMGKAEKRTQADLAQMVASGTLWHPHDFLIFQLALFSWLMIFIFATYSFRLHSTLACCALK